MATKLVSVVDSRWKKKKPTKRISKRRKLKSALKRIFNYMKSDSYMFAPLIKPQSSLPSAPVSSAGEVFFKPMMKKEKKLVEDVNDYLKCDTYMYAPLAMDSAYDGTTTPPSEDRRGGKAKTAEGDDEHSLTSCRDMEHSILHSERVNHIILHQNWSSLSSTEMHWM